VLVGASIGGRAVVTAAARGGPRQVDGVVSLSGERILGAQRDLLVDARRLRVPVLWVSSENDGYTTFAAETRQLYRAARGRARPDLLLVVGGDDHGIDLLTGAQARRVVPAVTRFIRGD
jgi:dienelactone hydrolase